jgi:hypothetical protein
MPDFHRLPGLNMNPGHAPGEWRRNLDGGLVGLDLEQRRVLGQHVTLVDEHLDDLGFGESLAQIRECERSRHSTLRTRGSRGRR